MPESQRKDNQLSVDTQVEPRAEIVGLTLPSVLGAVAEREPPLAAGCECSMPLSYTERWRTAAQGFATVVGSPSPR
jgi:hypothetical protein